MNYDKNTKDQYTLIKQSFQNLRISRVQIRKKFKAIL